MKCKMLKYWQIVRACSILMSLWCNILALTKMLNATGLICHAFNKVGLILWCSKIDSESQLVLAMMNGSMPCSYIILVLIWFVINCYTIHIFSSGTHSCHFSSLRTQSVSIMNMHVHSYQISPCRRENFTFNLQLIFPNQTPVFFVVIKPACHWSWSNSTCFFRSFSMGKGYTGNDSDPSSPFFTDPACISTLSCTHANILWNLFLYSLLLSIKSFYFQFTAIVFKILTTCILSLSLIILCQRLRARKSATFSVSCG